MRVLATIALATLAVVAVTGQQYRQPAGNYEEEYAEYEAPRPVHRPSPRSYAGAQAPAAQRQAPEAPKPTPVAILKQINRHNEDGSYTYGFEGGDGSFKIETKLPNGEVKGKYGFVDDTGKVRVVEYGANQYGFQPSGEGITVAPPTLVDETTNKDGIRVNQNYNDYDYQTPAPVRQPARPAPAPRQPEPAYEPRYQQAQYQAPAPAPAPAQAPAQFRPQYQPQYQPQQSRAQTQAIYAPQPQARPRIPQNQPLQRPIFESAEPAPQQAYPQRPAPVHQPQVYDGPASARAQFNQQGPVQFAPAPQAAPRPEPHQRSSHSGSILDQLARDYALPQNVAAPLHDISFGTY